MTSTVQNVIAIGLPFTGKTTFLAAFWDVVGSGEIIESLQLDQLTGDRQYLNEIRDKWADFHELPRTLLKDEGVFSMRLRDAKKSAVHELNFADMSGESSERQWTERICSQRYLKQISEATGVLLFVHPQKINRATLIRDAERLVRLLPVPNATDANSKRTANADAGTTSGATPIPTKPTYAATQVQLVELLQVIELHSEQEPPFRIGVVISAFDTVINGTGPLPATWLKNELPLLHQYLASNPELFQIEFFGVSAQGGDLKDAAELRRQSVRASDRIIVIRDSKRSHDISEPVRWILGLID